MEFNATFLATIVTFVVFVILMNKILYVPILKIMETRKSFINDNYSQASDNEIKINELEQKRNSCLIDAHNEAKESYNETIEDFKEQRKQMLDGVRSECQDKLEKSGIELANLSNEVKIGLRDSMTDLANDIVEKVIGYRSDIKECDENLVNNILWEK